MEGTNRQMSRHCTGVTLVELLILVAVVAVLAGTAISLLSGGHLETAGEDAAHRLATDLAFAQANAIANRSERLVIFSAVEGSYSVCSAGGTPLTHPVTKKPFLVELTGLYRGANVAIQTANFGGSDTLRIGVDGIPVSGGKVMLYAGGTTWQIAVADGTGHISISG